MSKVRDGAFAREALEHAESLYNFARQLTGDAGAAEDLVQDTYTRALAAANTFTPGSNARAWLFRILHNSFIDGNRSSSRMRIADGDADDHSAERAANAFEPLRGDIELEALRGVVAASIESALAALSPEARAVVLLDMKGFSETEVAEVLGCPIGTVKSRLMRARESLRARLAAFRR